MLSHGPLDGMLPNLQACINLTGSIVIRFWRPWPNFQGHSFMTEIATIDWFGRWGTSVFTENTAIFILFHIKLIYQMMFEIDKFHEIRFFGRVFNIWIFSVCHQNLQVFWPFMSNQKLAAMYIEVCFKSVTYSWFCLIICCSNALAENISLTLISVLERFSVPH